MSEKIEAGDVVTLKSGGPRMTVCKVDQDGLADVVWFPSDDSPTIEMAHINVKILEKVK